MQLNIEVQRIAIPGVNAPDADGEASKSEDGACTAAAIPASDDDTAPHKKPDNVECSHNRLSEADSQSAGDKTIAKEIAMGGATRNMDMVLCAATSAATRTRAEAHIVRALYGAKVNFSTTITTFNVIPYSDHYAHHPSQIVATRDGLKLVKTHAGRFTGKCIAVMDARKRRVWNRYGLDNASTRRGMILQQQARYECT